MTIDSIQEKTNTLVAEMIRRFDTNETLHERVVQRNEQHMWSGVKNGDDVVMALVALAGIGLGIVHMAADSLMNQGEGQ